MALCESNRTVKDKTNRTKRTITNQHENEPKRTEAHLNIRNEPRMDSSPLSRNEQQQTATNRIELAHAYRHMCFFDVNHNQDVRLCVISCTASNRDEPRWTALKNNELHHTAAGKPNRIEPRCPMNRNEPNRSNTNRNNSRNKPFINRTCTNRNRNKSNRGSAAFCHQMSVRMLACEMRNFSYYKRLAAFALWTSRTETICF